jgi:hypothetical protein
MSNEPTATAMSIAKSNEPTAMSTANSNEHSQQQ